MLPRTRALHAMLVALAYLHVPLIWHALAARIPLVFSLLSEPCRIHHLLLWQPQGVAS